MQISRNTIFSSPKIGLMLGPSVVYSSNEKSDPRDILIWYELRHYDTVDSYDVKLWFDNKVCSGHKKWVREIPAIEAMKVEHCTGAMKLGLNTKQFQVFSFFSHQNAVNKSFPCNTVGGSKTGV